MKNTEETKEVPDVDEIVREELRNEFTFSVVFSQMPLRNVRQSRYEMDPKMAQNAVTEIGHVTRYAYRLQRA